MQKQTMEEEKVQKEQGFPIAEGSQVRSTDNEQNQSEHGFLTAEEGEDRSTYNEQIQSEHGFLTTERSEQGNTNEKVRKERGCCYTFWGPFWPLLGGDTLEEAGGSVCFSTFIVFLWRAAMAASTTSTFVVYIIRGEYGWRFISSWNHIGLGAAFCAMTAASLFLIIKEKTGIAFRGYFFSSLAVFLFQIFGTAAVWWDIMYWTLIFEYDRAPLFSEILQHVINSALVLFDIVFSFRMQFKVSYLVIGVLYMAGYLRYTSWHHTETGFWLYGFQDKSVKPIRTIALYYTILISTNIMIGIVMFMFSRISRCSCLIPPSEEAKKKAVAKGYPPTNQSFSQSIWV